MPSHFLRDVTAGVALAGLRSGLRCAAAVDIGLRSSLRTLRTGPGLPAAAFMGVGFRMDTSLRAGAFALFALPDGAEAPFGVGQRFSSLPRAAPFSAGLRETFFRAAPAGLSGRHDSALTMSENGFAFPESMTKRDRSKEVTAAASGAILPSASFILTSRILKRGPSARVSRFSLM